MKVDLIQIPDVGALKVRTGAGSFVSSLKEGDYIKAEVLSGSGGIVVMRTDDGNTFKARPEPDVILSPGDQILLEMVGKEAGIVSLSIREEIPADAGASGQPTPVQDFGDKTLLPYANKLAELNMPVTEENVRLIRELLAQNPDMNPDIAAFIASNKLMGDERLIKAAISLLSGGEKTGVMLERLIATLPESWGEATEIIVQNQEPEPQPPQAVPPLADEDAPDTPPTQTATEDAASDAPLPGGNNASGVQPTQAAPLPAGNATPAAPPTQAEPLPEGDAAHVAPPTQTVPHPGGDAAPAAPPTQAAQPTTGDTTTPVAPLTQTAPHPVGNDTPGILPTQTAPHSAGDTTPAAPLTQTAPHPAADTTPAAPPEQTAPTPAGDTSPNASQTQTTPHPAVDAAPYIPPTQIAPPPPAFLDNVFTRIEREDKDAGIRIKNSKAELAGRLTLIEEIVSRAQTPDKALILEQTGRLMDHFRLLDNINQFAYMQIPVQIDDERKTAELYMFKKKTGKRLDPENVNILLALDLENMGHWEGLINFRNKDVSIKMEVPGRKEKEYFSENTVLLHELLAEAGFRLAGAEITYTEKETTPLTALSAFLRHTSKRTGIDFTV